ncbi:arm repeat-containing protein [Phaffia rhodozyma]|uniref:Arm repeat-containing protein n=1 Tax=Phaffia rhodozyma TaxID=264483 RepID=A0A0F7SKD4_PHARH|nr:arm repeat-containing protein [Phaffia rhodozyma]
MDYFRSLGTSILQSSGVVLPFALGEKNAAFEREGTIWNMHNAIKRDDNSRITVFVFDSSLPYDGRADRKALLPVAKNALKKIRATRHPDVLKFIDAYETESVIYIATEPVRSLSAVLDSTSNPSLTDDELVWGLHRISRAVAFLNSQAVSIHGLVHRRSSIFLTDSGEWRLGALDLLSSTRSEEKDTQVLWTTGGLVVRRGEGVSPEVMKAGWGVLKDAEPTSNDAYSLALLIHAVFNPSLPLPPTVTPPHPAPQPSSRGAIPQAIFPLFKRLLNPNPKTRLTATMFLQEAGGADGTDGSDRRGFFGGNRLVWICKGLEGWGLSGEGERVEILKAIQAPSPPLPPLFLTHKILPSLLHTLSLPSSPNTSPSAASSPSQLLPLVLKLGKLLSPEEYPKLVLEPVIGLFKSPDRGTRMALLEGLPQFESFLSESAVREKVWPNLITGFADTVPVIREATVQAIPLIAPKLSDRLLNNDLLRLLAKSQMDPEPSIRTNTCILLGRLVPHLGPNTKRKVLVPAFARALKDGFIHARVAGLMAFMATVEAFEMDDLAGRVLPVVCGALVDKEKLVRDQAFIAVNMFMKRLEKMVASMPETIEPVPVRTISGQTNGFSADAPTTQAQAYGNGDGGKAIGSAAGAAGALAGWAFASIGKTLASSDLQSTMAVPTASIPGSFNPPYSSSPSISPRPSTSGPSSDFSRPAAAPTPNINTKPSNGMRLTSSSAFSSNAKKTQFNIDEILAEETEVADAWGIDEGGGGDLIDMDRDEDDWGGFEEAPTPLYPSHPTTSTKPQNTSTPASKQKPKAATTLVSRSSSAAQPSRSRSAPPVVEADDDWGLDVKDEAIAAPPPVVPIRTKPKPSPIPTSTTPTLKTTSSTSSTPVRSISPAIPASSPSAEQSAPQKNKG